MSTVPATTTAKALGPVEALKVDLAKLSFRDALPEHVSEEKFKRVLLTAASRDTKLAEANRQSVYMACMRCAQDGLLPDGREAAITTFFSKKEGQSMAQYMPMVGGILKKVRNSGELGSISAQVIHKADPFKHWIDEKGEHLSHEPSTLAADRGEVVGVYAVATTKDGACYIEVMSKAEVEAIRASSRTKDAGPWVEWWSEMAKKSAIRRLSKRLPMSTDLEDVIRRDDDLYDVEPKDEPKALPASPTGPVRLSKIIDAATGDAEPKAAQPATAATTEESPL